MENLFDILIISLIIYALLAPFFRKKPQVQKKPEPFPYESDEEFEPKEEKSSQEILREIEELFGYKTKEPEEIIIQSDEEFRPPETKETKVEEFKQKFEKPEPSKKPSPEFEEKTQIYPVLQAYDYEGTIPEIEIDEFDYSKLDEDYQQIDADLDKIEEIKVFALELRKIDDFKKAIIYKEIFDTPIALRMRKIKWQRNIL